MVKRLIILAAVIVLVFTGVYVAFTISEKKDLEGSLSSAIESVSSQSLEDSDKDVEANNEENDREKEEDIIESEKNEMSMDEGSYYKATNRGDIEVDNKTGESYVKDQLLVITEDGVSKETIEELVSEMDAEIVGYIDMMDMYQIEFNSSKTYEELEKIIEKLEEFPYVEMASLNYEVETDED